MKFLKILWYIILIRKYKYLIDIKQKDRYALDWEESVFQYFDEIENLRNKIKDLNHE